MILRILYLKLIILSLSIFQSCKSTAKTQSYDVVIYGATSAGIVAAIQVSRMGKSVVIIEPYSTFGGLTTGGLGYTDIGNKHVIGGIALEFYKGIAKKYNSDQAWKWQKKAEYKNFGQGVSESTSDAMWTFEPKVAMEVFKDMMDQNQIEIIFNERLNLDEMAIKNDGYITSIIMESGRKYSGKIFIDATYEGDLMAVSGVSYTVGRESNDKFGEKLNGVQKKLAIYHQFPDHVDPYIEKGLKQSGLLPNVNLMIKEDGTGDNKIQAYCFRMCLTNIAENRVMIDKPEGYSEIEYELLFRAIENGYTGPFFIMSEMPNGKTDSNNKGPLSSDYIGRNYEYPEGNYQTRERIIKEHKTYQQGLLWTLANHPRIPDTIRKEFQAWGLPKDEFIETGHWSPQLYIREARRMVSDFVMTEHHCTQDSISAQGSVGMGAYTMDSHHMQRYVNDRGFVQNEGDVEVGGFGPYPIGFKAIVPKENECKNLIVPICLSATHIAFGSIRMEPVFMVLAQSAGTAACLAIDQKVPVQQLEYESLKRRLLKDNQILNH